MMNVSTTGQGTGFGPERALRIAVVLLAVYVGFIGVFGFFHGNVHTGDTDNLVQGTRTAVECLRHGHFRGCGLTPGTRASAVFPYPFLQYVPATLLVQVGLSDAHVLRSLAAISFLAYAASFVLLLRAGRRLGGRLWTPALLIVMLTGPFPYYAVSSFGEMLAASVVLAAAAAALSRRTKLTIALVLVASLAKETFPPFVAALAMLIVWRVETDRGIRRRSYFGIGIACFAALLVNFGFNVFRYATWRNLNYLSPEFNVPIPRRLDFLAMLLFAPQGGLLWFWPAALLILGLLAASLWAVSRNAGARDEIIARVLLLLVWSGFFAGLASWVSPFGWISWGPRLALPLLPALIVASVVVGGDPLSAIVRTLFRWKVIAVGLAITLAAAALPQFALPWTHAQAIQPLLAADSTCPSIFDTPVQKGREIYFRCTSHLAWRLRPNQLSYSVKAGSWQAWEARVLGLACCLALFAAARFAIRTAPRERRCEPELAGTVSSDDSL